MTTVVSTRRPRRRRMIVRRRRMMGGSYRPVARVPRAIPMRRSRAPAPPRATHSSQPTSSYSTFTDALPTIGGGIGSLFGPAGSAIGSLLGHGASSLVKLVSGFGDYSVNQNSLLPGALEPPIIRNDMRKGSHGIVVRHREYIMDITSTTAFTPISLDINAGLPETFPWLSQIASSFEEYCIHGMLFEFKSMSSDAVLSSAANSALGTVIMATQYNVLNPPFADKRTMENYEFSNSAKPSESFIHPIECKASETPYRCYYVRTGAIPTGSDQRLYDLGAFTIATQGMQSSTGTIGELWVTFEIEFLKPKLISDFGGLTLTDHYQLAAVDNTHPLGSISVGIPVSPVAGSSLGTQLQAGGGSTYYVVWPATVSTGNFLVSYSVTGTTAAIVPPMVSNHSNCAFAAYWSGDTAASVMVPSGATSSVYITNFIVVLSGPSASIQFGAAGTLPSAITTGDLWITQINGGITS